VGIGAEKLIVARRGPAGLGMARRGRAGQGNPVASFRGGSLMGI